MFREMRRKGQELSEEDTRGILASCTSGVLAVQGDDGYPYAVPMSYVFDESRIILHCAKEGHKIDAIRRSDKVSFCVIAQDDIVPQEFTTYYRSAIAFGRARIVEDEGEKRAALLKLAAKYSPGDEDGQVAEVEKTLSRVCIVIVDIDHLSGKESIEFVKRRKAGGK